MKSLREKSFTRYLLYAIGEIILVVIGILIALQVNNWNEQRKFDNQAVELLQNLKKDLSSDVEQLEANISRTEKRNAEVDSILGILANPDNSELPRFMAYQMGLLYDDYFTSSRATFEEGVSSGKINLISEDTIRRKLFQYYANTTNERIMTIVPISLLMSMWFPLY